MLLNETLASGNITTQNLNPNSGAATTGGTVEVYTVGQSTAGIQVTGTYTGALTPQVSVDGTNWIALGATGLVNINTGVYSATVASAAVGIFQVNVSGFQKFRLSANAAVTGTAVVSVRANATDGALALANPIPAGANAIGTVQIGNTANTTPILANPGNPTDFNLNSAATTNATSVKATAGNLYVLNISNLSAAPKFVKLYNKASAPTVGTDVPLDVFEVAANSSRSLPFGTSGIRFTTGIAYAITGAQPDSDTTAVAAGDVKVHGAYI